MLLFNTKSTTAQALQTAFNRGNSVGASSLANATGVVGLWKVSIFLVAKTVGAAGSTVTPFVTFGFGGALKTFTGPTLTLTAVTDHLCYVATVWHDATGSNAVQWGTTYVAGAGNGTYDAWVQLERMI